MLASARRLKKTGRLTLLTPILTLLSFVGWSQEVTVDASVNKNPVAPGEAFQVTVTIYNSNGDVKFPNLAGAQFLYGPSTGQSMQIINGSRTSEFTYTYTFRAGQVDQITIPSISVKTNDGVKKTQAFKIRVAKGSTKTANKNFMTIIEPSKRKVYLGEPIVLKYKVIQRYGNFNIDSYELPEFDGFWVESVEDHQGRWEQKVINGQRYSEAVLKIDVIFPQKTGEFNLEGFSMRGVVGSFFNRQEVNATSSPLKIEVLPLPDGKPANFIGTFPNLSLKVEHSELQVKANEAVNLSLSFSGKGNLKLISEPDFSFPTDLEVFDPELTDRLTINVAGASGKRKFNYTLIPRSPGNYTIPGKTFSYFNSSSKKYETLRLDPMELVVAKGEDGADVAYSFNSKSDVQILNKEIRHIIPESGGLKQPANIFFGSATFYLAYGAPFLLFAGFFFFMRKRENDLNDMDAYRKRMAGKTFKKFLSEAQGAVGDQSKFYAALGVGLENYLMDKLSLGRSELNKRNVEGELDSRIPPELKDAFMALWTKCESARFAPSSQVDMKADLETAKSLMLQIEKEL